MSRVFQQTRNALNRKTKLRFKRETALSVQLELFGLAVTTGLPK